MSLTEQIKDDMKQAMREKQMDKLTIIRMLLAAIKQQEIDNKITLDDSAVITVINKMIKQGRDSIKQFEEAGRNELAAKEQAEIIVLQNYLPPQLDDAEIDQLIKQAIADTGAESMKDMGKLMGTLKPKFEGRVDMSVVSAKIKAALSS